MVLVQADEGCSVMCLFYCDGHKIRLRWADPIQLLREEMYELDAFGKRSVSV